MRLRSAAAVAALAGSLACASGGNRRAREIPVPPPTHPVAELEQGLASPDSQVRAAAAWEITGAPKLSDATLKTLLDLSHSDVDPTVRNAAAWAFGHQALDSPAGREMSGHVYDQAAKLAQQVRLVYPKAAFDAKITGTVDVEILIDEQGNVARAEVRKSIPGLDEAALANVRQWKFEPARKAGKPVPTTARAPVTFRMY